MAYISSNSFTYWIKRNLITTVQVPEFVIGSVESKEIYSIPNFCERQFNILSKCKFPLTKDELKDLKICTDFKTCPLQNVSRAVDYEISQIGNFAIYTYAPNLEQVCLLLLSNKVML